MRVVPLYLNRLIAENQGSRNPSGVCGTKGGVVSGSNKYHHKEPISQDDEVLSFVIVMYITMTKLNTSSS